MKPMVSVALRGWVCAALLGSGTACKREESANAASPSGDEKRPNIVLISIDSLRADHLSCYGYLRKTSPTIDKLAKEGTLFETMVSSTSWTLPSHATMLTGLPDSVHGCDRNDRYLLPNRRTLAEALKEGGYATAGFWSGPYLHPIWGMNQGFDSYINCASYEAYSQHDVLDGARGTEATPSQSERREMAHKAHEDITSPTILKEVNAWLDANGKKGSPFFLFIHMWDVHYDYIPPPPYDTMYDPDYKGTMTGRNLWGNQQLKKGLEPRDLEHLKALYDGEITYTDMHVGKIMEKLGSLGLADTTVIAITGDHGEEFFEHGRFGHHHTVYEESIRVPLVVRYPPSVPSGKRDPQLARMVDITPTLLQLAGLSPLETMGRSLFGEDSDPGDVVAISELVQETKGKSLLAIRTGDFKLILEPETGKRIGLWDLRRDPDEQSNLLKASGPLADKADAVFKQTHQALLAMQERFPWVSDGQVREKPKDMTEALRQLGYADEDEEDEESDHATTRPAAPGDDVAEPDDGC